MAKRSTSRQIKAPVEIVFSAITDLEKFPDKNPDIVKIEILSEQKTGIGTRFIEIRRMGKREGSTELECTEYVENELVRFVADQGGTIWDSVFTTSAKDGGTELTLEMDARPYKLMPKIIMPMILGMIAKAVEKDMDAVKEYCEREATAQA